MPIDDDSLKRIRRHQDAYNRRIQLIRADVTLSPEGKRRAMAVARHRALADIEQIKAAAEQTYRGRRAELEKHLFGIRDIPDDINAAISYRDAQDRVAELKTGAEAQLMMRRAIRSGDGLLARALFDRGWELAGNRMMNSGWGEVVNAYVQELRPDLADQVNELAHLQQIDTRERRTGEAIETSVYRPPEMEGMSPADITAAVADADTAGLTPGAGTTSDPTPGQAFAQMTRESADGAYGA